MTRYRTSLSIATAVLSLSWSVASRADDTQMQHGTTQQGGQPSTNMPSSSGSTYGTSGTTTPGTMPPSTGTMPPSGTTPMPGTTMPPETTMTPPTGTTTTTAGYPPPIGAEQQETTIRPNRPMLITGAVVFAGTYGASVIVGAASSRPSDDKLFIPVVGPWLDLGERCGSSDPPCSTGSSEDWNKALLIGSGVLQGAGVLTALISLFVPEKKEAPPMSAAKAKPVKPEVRVTPLSFRAGGGLGAVGTF